MQISDKRRTLSELTSDIVIELLELKMLSERRESLEVLDESHLDAELTALLENLQSWVFRVYSFGATERVDVTLSQLTTVLERCLKTRESRNNSRLQTLKAVLTTWIEHPKIEADIARLRDHVSSFHRRFIVSQKIR